MFICAITHKCSLPREPMVKVVVETRKVLYTNLIEDEEGRSSMRTSSGVETVREVGVSKEGYDILMRQQMNASLNTRVRVQ